LIGRTVPRTVIPWQLPLPDSVGSDDYRHVLARLYTYSEVPRTERAARLGRERKLDRMRALLDAAGNPQARFQTILVAGTKGKGSMAAVLSSVLHAAGIRVGRYTQPHLYSHRERIWANGQFITQHGLVEAFDSLRPAMSRIERNVDLLGPLTTFDAGTALALSHFSREHVEIAVVEVGVGGARDATNALEPTLSLIGPIGIDHSETLGTTIPAIAREKAGVMRRGVPVISSHQVEEAAVVIRACARERDSRLYELGSEFFWETSREVPANLTVRGRLGSVERLSPPLSGRCQRDNLATAVMGALWLRQSGWRITDDDIRSGLGQVSWPGRFQTVVLDPLTIVDGAHNPASARALAETVVECLPSRAVTLVVGMSVDKDAVATLAELAPVVSRVVATRARHPRSYEPSRLAVIADGLGLPATVEPNAEAALQSAWAGLPPSGAVLVAGSLFLAGDVLEWLWRESGGCADNTAAT